MDFNSALPRSARINISVDGDPVYILANIDQVPYDIVLAYLNKSFTEGFVKTATTLEVLKADDMNVIYTALCGDKTYKVDVQVVLAV